ncbi:Uncharacterised protein [Pseudomonas luteola]|uniref:Uncharacterized protein n=2 Tax=Pseudomonas TaxID=286 RepID=A0A2X2C6S0_PSELU|nr:Uncharacterised protein [Pseudomonas luteola]
MVAKRPLLLSSRLWMPLLASILVVLVALAFDLAGIKHLGSVQAWSAWRNEAYWYFFAWRLCLYAGLAYGWWWMRKRVLKREPTMQARARLRNGGLGGVVTLVVFELVKADVF